MVLLVFVDANEVVIIELICVPCEFMEVHPWYMVLAAHHIDSLENCGHGDDLFLANILKEFREGSKKHQVLPRLTFQSLADLRPMLVLVDIQNGLVSHSDLSQDEFLIGCLLDLGENFDEGRFE